MKSLTPERIVIGSKFWGHDSSVFVVLPKEQRLFALQTERVTRYKHDWTAPTVALERLIEREGVDVSAVKQVVFCNSFSRFDNVRLPEDFYIIERLYRAHFKSPYKKDAEAARGELKAKSRVGQTLDLFGSLSGWQILARKALLAVGLVKVRTLSEIETNYLRKLFPNAQVDIRFFDHEYCHAVCAYTTSPFDQALVCTMDGWGDGNFSRVYTAVGGTFTPIAVSPREHVEDPQRYDAYMSSLGGIYSYFTKRLGFTPEEDEGKVEALAAYGKPVVELLAALQSVVTIRDFSVEINDEIFDQYFAPEKFEVLMQKYTKEELSATVQAFLDGQMLAYIPKLVEETGIRNIAFAGGVAANVINNLAMYEHVTSNIHITPAMGDDGSAQGAAYAYLLESGEDMSWIKKLQMPYYETSYTKEEVESVLKLVPGITYTDWGSAWPEKTAELVAGNIIGAIFHGAAEWGPRALGHRSIIADTRRKDFRDIINKTIKRRPLFQPFCPSMLAEERERLFESAYLNKHMTCAFRLKKEYWDVLPSAIHVDGTARVQFVEEGDDANYYRLLKKVKELTGYGVIINTSFNKHGRTIVESPQDAIDDFLDTDMEYLVIEGFYVTRS